MDESFKGEIRSFMIDTAGTLGRIEESLDDKVDIETHEYAIGQVKGDILGIKMYTKGFGSIAIILGIIVALVKLF